jgi:hypothetical protein
MAVNYRDASGTPILIPVEAALAHPLYRPNAIRERVMSIDVALIRTARPLDPRFVGASLAMGADLRAHPDWIADWTPNKSRYVFFAGSHRERKAVRTSPRYPVLPYPKRTNVRAADPSARPPCRAIPTDDSRDAVCAQAGFSISESAS